MGRTACTEPQCLYKGALYLYLYLLVVLVNSMKIYKGSRGVALLILSLVLAGGE